MRPTNPWLLNWLKLKLSPKIGKVINKMNASNFLLILNEVECKTWRYENWRGISSYHCELLIVDIEAKVRPILPKIEAYAWAVILEDSESSIFLGT